jgi:hypothetical protein
MENKEIERAQIEEAIMSLERLARSRGRRRGRPPGWLKARQHGRLGGQCLEDTPTCSIRTPENPKLVCTRDEYSPPDGWTQEPDNFVGLKLDMTKAEAERHVTFGKCTVTKDKPPGFPAREHFVYETTLNVGGLTIPGKVLFIEDRLIGLEGKFDMSLCDAITSTFIDLYGRPHVDERRETLNQGVLRSFEWQGDRVRLGIFADGILYFTRTSKGTQAMITVSSAKSATRCKKHPEFVSPWESGDIGNDDPGVREPVDPKPPHQPPMAAKVPLPQ